LVLLCCGVNRLIGLLSRVARFIAVRQCERVVREYSTSLAWDLLLRVFLLFFEKNKCCFAKVMGGGRFLTLGPQYLRYHSIIHGPHQ